MGVASWVHDHRYLLSALDWLLYPISSEGTRGLGAEEENNGVFFEDVTCKATEPACREPPVSRVGPPAGKGKERAANIKQYSRVSEGLYTRQSRHGAYLEPGRTSVAAPALRVE